MSIVFLLSVASRVANACVLVSVTLAIVANALVGFASATANPESILPLMNFIVATSACVVVTSAATVACLISAARKAGSNSHTEADAMPQSIHYRPLPDGTATAPVEVKADSKASEVAAVEAKDDSSRHAAQNFSDQTPGEVVINGGAESKKRHGQNDASKDDIKNDDTGHCLFCFPGQCACGDRSSGCGSGPCRCFEKDGDRKSSDGKSISTTSSDRRRHLEMAYDEYVRETEEHYEYGDGRDAFDAMMRMREADY